MKSYNLSQYEEPQHFSVSEISSKIKKLLENNLGYVKIKGEISGFIRASSGHGYFSLKDEKAVLSATCWRHNLVNIDFKLEEGLEVVVSGKITAYAGQSKYQISVDKISPAGAGAFMQILRERKAKLEKEGLFAKEKKQNLPFFPKTIGIITSPSGAVIKDIIHRISDRCPTRLIVWPVTVQGETSAQEVSDAIAGFNKLTNNRPDLLIVARGGGSIEDLWSFNEEIVVRSAFNSKIPLISAIGHETDYTLLDLVADKRAPTPTAAAEFAVPVLADLKYTINTQINSIIAKFTQRLKYNIQILQGYDRILHYPTNYFNNYIQRVDEFGMRLMVSMPQLLQNKTQLYHSFPIARFTPEQLISIKQIRFKVATDFLNAKKRTLLDIFYNKYEMSNLVLDSLDYRKVLKRGYAMIKNPDGQYLSSKKSIQTAVNENEQLELLMHDGKIKITTA